MQLGVELLDFYDDTESVVAQSNVAVKCVRVQNIQVDVWAVNSARARADEVALHEDSGTDDSTRPPIPAKDDMNDVYGRASLVLLAACRLGADDAVRLTLFKNPQGDIAKIDVDWTLSQFRVVAQPWHITALLDMAAILTGRKHALSIGELRSRRNRSTATSWTDMCGSLLMAMADDDDVHEEHWRESLRDKLHQILDSTDGDKRDDDADADDQFLECNTGVLVSAPDKLSSAYESPNEAPMAYEAATESRHLDINLQLNVHEVAVTLPYVDLSLANGSWTADTPVALPHGGDQLVIAIEGLNGDVELMRAGVRFDLEAQELVVSEALRSDEYEKYLNIIF